jgi:simple sugar transport system permease protein
MNRPPDLPRWLDVGVLPLVNLAFALAACGAVVALVGIDPMRAVELLVAGAFGSRAGFSYTLYYATTFLFTGLAVAVALHGGLFNIGGEGQAMLGGLGATLVALWLGSRLPAPLALPAVIVAAALGGALWAAVPAALQAWRGSHVVITTIMANFIASALLAWLLVHVLKEPGNMTLESGAFPPAARVPGVHEALGWIGIDWPRTPLNLSLLLALAAAAAVHVDLWHRRGGYELRAVGFAPDAAAYAGMRPRALTMRSMLASGALAGLVAVNELAGVQGRLLLDFVAGAGFAGIAVALIGRGHPLGIALAALLFGALHQGGAELAFEIPGFSREMVTLLQGLIVLFSGALAYVAAPWLAAAWRAVSAGAALPLPPAADLSADRHGPDAERGDG